MSASVRPSAMPLGVPLVERKSLIGFRTACERLWGPAGYKRVCELLPSDVRERTAGMVPLPKWNTVEDLVAWHHAVWDGPAGRDERTMTQHIHATVDQGFGRVKKFLLSVSTPRSLAPRVAALWQEEYSTGRLEAIFSEERVVHLVLTDHPFIDDPLMRFVISEVFRYVLSMTRVHRVSVSYGMRGAALVVVLRWD